MRDDLSLPLELMRRDAATAAPSDLSCHVFALCEEVEKLAEACAAAYRHLDTYGVVTGGHRAEMESQTAAFLALGPFVRRVGHTAVPVYPSEPRKGGRRA